MLTYILRILKGAGQVDAEGLDGEGVQIGDGEVNFSKLASQLARLAPDAGFIPEICKDTETKVKDSGLL